MHDVDLAYLRAHPEQLPLFLTHQRIRETTVPGGDICAAAVLTLDDGSSLFTKSWPETAELPRPDGFFEAEAMGLAWLRDAGSVPVPEVLVALPQMIAMEWIPPGPPGAAAAERFGRELAGMHRAGAPTFGADWPGFIGALPLDNTPDPGPWPQWFARRRLEPYLRRSVDRGALPTVVIRQVEQIIAAIERYAGPAGDEPPARLHGDLWPGNLMWAATGPGGTDSGTGRVWLVDPAAQGGHRETDLAFLGLFGGAPFLDTIMAAYNDAWPLADGWRERRDLHQLHLLLVHTALFGPAYRDAVARAAAAVLRTG